MSLDSLPDLLPALLTLRAVPLELSNGTVNHAKRILIILSMDNKIN